MRRTDVLVIGAGIAGVRTAQALRRQGFAGRLTVVGAEPHDPYDRPPLSKEHLVSGDGLRSLDADWAGIGVEALLGRRAVRADTESRTVDLDDGTSVGYRTLVIATGATPRRITGAPGGSHVLRTVDDVARLRAAFTGGARVAVVGAGFIGCEIASSARALGLDVVLIDALPAPLAGVLGPVVGALVAGLHRDHGVDVRCGAGVSGIAARPWRIDLLDRTAIEADVVVEAIGVRPSCAWLDGSGLDVTDGVLCDRFGATSVPGVWAVGDVARWWHPRYGAPLRFEHWTSAVEQANVLARNIIVPPAERRAFDGIPYFWSDQHGVKIQSLGRPAPADEVHVLPASAEDRRLLALYTRDGTVTGVVGLDRARDVMRLRRCLESPTPLNDAVRIVAA